MFRNLLPFGGNNKSDGAEDGNGSPDPSGDDRRDGARGRRKDGEGSAAEPRTGEDRETDGERDGPWSKVFAKFGLPEEEYEPSVDPRREDLVLTRPAVGNSFWQAIGSTVVGGTAFIDPLLDWILKGEPLGAFGVFALALLGIGVGSLLVAATTPRHLATLTPGGIHFEVDGLGFVPWDHMKGYKRDTEEKLSTGSEFSMPLHYPLFYQGRFRRGVEVYFGVRRQMMTWNREALHINPEGTETDARAIDHYLAAHLDLILPEKKEKEKEKDKTKSEE